VRSPTDNATEVEATIEAVRGYLSLHKRLGWLRKSDPEKVALLYLALLSPGEPMPEGLSEYLSFRSLSEQPAGKATYTNRNLVITRAVEHVRHRLDLPATRNDATRVKQPDNESACSIVTAILSRLGVHLSERTVEDIWTELRSPYDEHEVDRFFDDLPDRVKDALVKEGPRSPEES
jgi:hypothetical protein